MPMDFPDMNSLTRRAEMRGFRQPNDGESEAYYRTALADHVRLQDPIESAEIRSGLGWDRQSPQALLFAITGKNPADLFKNL